MTTWGELFSWTLSLAANFAQVATGMIATVVGGHYMWQRRKRRVALESYLQSQRSKDERPATRGNGLRTVLHITARLAMTEQEVLEAAFSSRVIKRWTASDPETNRASVLFLQYDKKGGANDDGPC